MNSINVWLYKKTHFEFFSINKIYIPVIFFIFFKMLRYGFFNWFNYINPLLKKSGLFGHSKYELLKYFSKEKTLQTIFISQGSTQNEVLKKVKNLEYPMVLKPNNLYRGIGIKKIMSENDFHDVEDLLLEDDYVIQVFSKKTKEYAVFYVRFPNEKVGTITSLVEKEFIYFIGDGNSTLNVLIKQHPRGRFFIKKLKEFYGEKMNSVPTKGEIIKSSFIGSHNKGTVFWDKSSRITNKMSLVFDNITKKVPSFYYGRYDIKANNINDIEVGNFDILELNGALAEPVHMYQPDISIKQGYGIIFKYWRVMFNIAKLNKGYEN